MIGKEQLHRNDLTWFIV